MAKPSQKLHRRDFFKQSGALAAGAALAAAQNKANLAAQMLGMDVPAAVPSLDPRTFLPKALNKGFTLPDGSYVLSNGKLPYLRYSDASTADLSKSQKDLLVKLLEEARDSMPKAPADVVSQYNTLTKNWHQFVTDRANAVKIPGGTETPFHALKAGESIPAGSYDSTYFDSNTNSNQHTFPEEFAESDFYNGSLSTPPSRLGNKDVRKLNQSKGLSQDEWIDPPSTQIEGLEREWSQTHRSIADMQRAKAKEAGDPKADQAHREAIHDLGLGGTARFDQPDVMQDTGEPTGLMGLPGSSQTNSRQNSDLARKLFALGVVGGGAAVGLSSQEAEAAKPFNQTIGGKSGKSYQELLNIIARNKQMEMRFLSPNGEITGQYSWGVPDHEGPINAKHVSNATFDRFDSSFLGTGQGHASFGEGNYFATDDAVRNSYLREFGNKEVIVDKHGNTISLPRQLAGFERFTELSDADRKAGFTQPALKSDDSYWFEQIRHAIHDVKKYSPEKDKNGYEAARRIEAIYRDMHDYPYRYADWKQMTRDREGYYDPGSRPGMKKATLRFRAEQKRMAELADWAAQFGLERANADPKTYEVELHVPERKVWNLDAPLSENPDIFEAVKKAFGSNGRKNTTQFKGMNPDRFDGHWAVRNYLRNNMGYDHDKLGLSRAMLEAGIPATSFLDGDSRSTLRQLQEALKVHSTDYDHKYININAPEADQRTALEKIFGLTKNYVMFPGSEDAIKILSRKNQNHEGVDLNKPTPRSEWSRGKYFSSIAAATAAGLAAGLSTQEAEAAAAKKMATLYRGETSIIGPSAKPPPDWMLEDKDYLAANDAAGRWFSRTPEEAQWYIDHAAKMGKTTGMSSLEVPEEDLVKYLVANQPKEVRSHSRRPDEEYFLPKDLAATRKRITALLAAGATGGAAAAAVGGATAQAQDPNASAEQESAFQDWYAKQAYENGLSPNPDDPEHQYDWRAAHNAGAEGQLAEDGYKHWPSEFKRPDHPNRFIDGIDTITGKPVVSGPQAWGAAPQQGPLPAPADNSYIDYLTNLVKGDSNQRQLGFFGSDPREMEQWYGSTKPPAYREFLDEAKPVFEKRVLEHIENLPENQREEAHQTLKENYGDIRGNVLGWEHNRINSRAKNFVDNFLSEMHSRTPGQSEAAMPMRTPEEVSDNYNNTGSDKNSLGGNLLAKADARFAMDNDGVLRNQKQLESDLNLLRTFQREGPNKPSFVGTGSQILGGIGSFFDNDEIRNSPLLEGRLPPSQTAKLANLAYANRPQDALEASMIWRKNSRPFWDQSDPNYRDSLGAKNPQDSWTTPEGMMSESASTNTLFGSMNANAYNALAHLNKWATPTNRQGLSDQMDTYQALQQKAPIVPKHLQPEARSVLDQSKAEEQQAYHDPNVEYRRLQALLGVKNPKYLTGLGNSAIGSYRYTLDAPTLAMGAVGGLFAGGLRPALGNFAKETAKDWLTEMPLQAAIGTTYEPSANSTYEKAKNFMLNESQGFQDESGNSVPANHPRWDELAAERDKAQEQRFQAQADFGAKLKKPAPLPLQQDTENDINYKQWRKGQGSIHLDYLDTMRR